MSPEPVRRSHLPRLTALRWLAASAVFLVHSPKIVGADWFLRISRPGAVGVSFFFILSGFLLCWSHSQRRSPRSFYRSRFARIYPAFFATAVVIIPFNIAAGVITTSHEIVLAVISLTLLHGWYPDIAWAFAGNNVSWSLSAEAFFYLCFPWLVGPIRRVTNARLWQIAVVCVAFSLSIAPLVRPTDELSTRYWIIYYSPFTRISEFILGIALGELFRRGVRAPLRLRPAAVLSIAAFLLAGWVPLWASPVAVTLLPLAALIWAAADADERDVPGWMTRSRWAQRLGVWSFAFYLVHVPVERLTSLAAKRLDAPFALRLVLLVAAYAAALGAAAVVHHVVEEPIARRLSSRPPRAAGDASDPRSAGI